ncbi:erythrocyte membrane protein 1, PfEMP1 [Plasmodium reichenowi]|uniref:Erythrocyte membrane protein 1, PfEMP1 n=1 Tax=Plasmodium reichenowi TaxID=5854 RepID=A0A2P9D5N0_PLARE|nr:erythrocyte membrane protein 1, PfEMP1 [Plasmodium reichenowi]
MAPGRGGAEDEIDDTSAKHLLDSIGKIVQQKIEHDDDAKKYREELKGSLSKAATDNWQTSYTTDTCQLVNDYHKKANERDDRYPCKKDEKGEEITRFSKERVAEYDEKKIGCSNSEGGACAPFRRLNMCVKNLETIETNNYNSGNAKHKLLAEVCLAAKYEGESLKTYHEQYEALYPSSGSTMCTELARSFADIGDIVRGRDLYLGKRKKQKEKETEREKLENKLKEYFQKVHSEVTNGKGKNVDALKARYEKETDPNYYKLREDWWTANRETVWKAITCKAHNGDAYFRATCSHPDGKGQYQTHDKCQCNGAKGANVVPTYFDYVPQYLRWFEEWAEDFCRKKKKKIENVKNKCRGEYNNEKRYCSLNGCDCKKTVRARGKLRYGNRCIDCMYACNPYVHWIDKKKEEFEKQKKKCEKEMQKYEKGASYSRRQKRGTTTNYDGYEKKFYDILKTDNRNVENFLEKLNNETDCQKVEDTEGGKIDFKEDHGDINNNDEKKGTFYHSQYCQPCPYCGMKRTNKGSNEWERKSKDDKCKSENLYEPNKDAIPSPITILKSGEKQKEIENKLNDFCNKSNSDKDSLYEEWKCYKGNDVQIVKDAKDEDEEEDIEDYQNIRRAGGLCILENNKGEEKVNKQKTFNDFFHFWVAHMLKDSIHWRTKKLKGCLKNDKKKCGNEKCKNDCDCFKRWVEKKQTEWDNIKSHFATQDDIQRETQMDPGVTLEYVLRAEYLEDDSEQKSKTGDEDAEEMKHLQEIMAQKDRQETAGMGTQNKTIIDLLIEYEETEAKECLQKYTCPPQPSRDPYPARSDEPRETVQQEDDSGGSDEEEEEFEEEDEEDKDRVSQDDGTEEEGPDVEAPQEPAQKENICKIVDDLFQNRSKFSDACSQKYSTPNRYWGWKCVTPTTKPNSDVATSEGSSKETVVARSRRGAPESSDSNGGAICVPPRRRRLYIGGLTKWVKEQLQSQVNGESGVSGNGDQAKGTEAVEHSSTALSSNPQVDSTPATSSRAQDPLLAAFVESAAVETFFLWDRYKKLNKTQGTGALGAEYANYGAGGTDGPFNRALPGMAPGGQADGVAGLQASPVLTAGIPPQPPLSALQPFPQPQPPPQLGSEHGTHDDALTSGINVPGALGGESVDSNDPEKQLKEGNIPDEFLRQMFYTLGDYRDIVVYGGDNKDTSGITQVDDNTNNNKTNIVLLASENKDEMKQIQEEIEKFLKQSGNEKSVKPVKPEQNSDKRVKWWDDNAKHIWDGMLCALTYADSGEKEKPPTKITDAETILGKLKDTYKYTDVKLEDTSDETRPRTSGDTLTLDSFVKRPTYFRYLEEWGEEFCLKRTEMLDKIEKDCKVGDDKYKCSGDGENCDLTEISKKGVFDDLQCPSCGKSCRWYKKWIRRKRTEFNEQSNAYGGQKGKCQTESKGADGDKDDKQFCGKLKDDAAEFLNNLGPCKNNDESGEGKKGGDILDFSQPDNTFKPADNCKPCSEFTVDCKNGKCSDDGTKVKCTGGKISASDIKDEKNVNGNIEMLVSDDNTNRNKFDDLGDCKDADIFKGIRKDEWKCGKVCGVDICTLEKNNNGAVVHEHITVKEFLKRWLETFFEDYNRINKKLKTCTNDKGSNCINGCEQKCKCVKKWEEEKRKEWKNIKEKYIQEYTKRNGDDGNNLSSFLEVVPFKNEVDKAIGPCPKLDDFLKSKKCNGTSRSADSEESTKYDGILCLLDRLKKQTESCSTPASGQSQEQCVNLAPPETPPQEPFEETEENKVDKPAICGDMPKPPEEKEDGKCGEEEENKKGDQGESDPAASTPEPIPNSDDPNKEQTPVLKPEEEAPAPTPPAPAQPEPHPPRRNPQVEDPNEYKLRDVLLPSAFPLTVGVGFLALTYWFLKKKSKPSVDLLSVLEIPQNDYDIPTLKSKNRYIPYKSAQYRGKRYIYIEGDSSSDEKYAFMSDTTDITSSESEYEELDINDIYVPGSPKYKTLIEVVLEPSKRDTQSDDTIPNSDIPSDNTPTNKFTEEEWNQLKKYFISNMLQNEPNDLPNILPDNVDNNTNPTPSRHNVDQKPFIMSIHDRNLLSGEEYSYDMSNTNSGNNDLYSGKNNLYSDIHTTSDNRGSYSDKRDSYSDKNDVYSGIDLINDSLNSGNHDIYNELLKRKENELFGTNHTKHTTTNIVAKPARDDPIHNQIDLFHKWLDRHRDMCEKFSNNKEELLVKLKEQWENKTHSGNKHSDIPSGKLSDTPSDNNIHSDIHPSDIPSGKQSDIPSDNNIHSDIPYVLNSDVSIQIDMDNPNQVDDNTYLDTYPDKSTMDTIMDDLEKYNEPYYDIYYDVNDHDASNVDSNNMDVPSKVKIEMSVKNTQMMEGKYPIGDVWDI